VLCVPVDHPVEMSICVGGILLGYQATDPFPGRIDNSEQIFKPLEYILICFVA